MVAYRTLVVRSPRRIRLEFSSALAAGAFDPSWFSLVCDDSTTADPEVVAALRVPDQAELVELAIDVDMAGGSPYTLDVAAGVPALDASTAAATTQAFRAPNPQAAPSEALSAQDLSDIIFQEDIAHHPTLGHIEGPDGDLAVVTGPPNVQANGNRAVASEGLPHRANWGAQLRSEVDAPNVPSSRLALRGKCEQQLRKDDRVTNARASVDDLGDGMLVVNAQIDLVGQLKSNIRSKVNARS